MSVLIQGPLSFGIWESERRKSEQVLHTIDADRGKLCEDIRQEGRHKKLNNIPYIFQFSGKDPHFTMKSGLFCKKECRPYADASRSQAAYMERIREAERNLKLTHNIDGLPLLRICQPAVDADPAWPKYSVLTSISSLASLC